MNPLSLPNQRLMHHF